MNNDNYDLFKSTMQKMGCIGRLHRSIFEKNISSLGIHHSQHCLLLYIAKRGEVDSQKEIAEKFGITPAAVARTLKGLEADGYIERVSFESDGRLNKIIITEKGKNIVNKSHILFKETDHTVFEDFSNDDLAIFNSYLDKMQSRLLEKYNEGCVNEANEKT